MKKKKRIIIGIALIIILGIYLIFFKGIYASSDVIIGPYKNAELYEEFLDYDYWQIGENIYDEPIFCYQDNALLFIKRRYADLLSKIYDLYHDEYKIRKLNKRNIAAYRKLSDQLICIDKQEDEQRQALIKLLDLYINGQKKWKYVIGKGWDRIYP